MAPKKKQTNEERLQKKREAEKRRQERIKADPELLLKEKEKWKKKYESRIQKGQIKLVNDMSRRQLKAQRKTWKEKKRNQRETKKKNTEFEEYLQINSPADSNDNNEVEDQPAVHNPESIKTDRRKESGEKRKKRNIAKAYRDRDYYKKKNEELNKKMKMYKKRYQRLKQQNTPKSPLTPKSKVNKFLKGKKVDEGVRKRLFEGEVFKSEFKKHYSELQSHKDKQAFKERLSSSKILKKYKLITSTCKLLQCSSKIKPTYVANKKQFMVSTKRLQVRHFLENDENSTMSPGKKDTITRNKVKMQKRYLNNSLLNLHKSFLEANKTKMSYALFCKFKPFWIIAPNVNKRDTCLCIKHSNFEMLLSSLIKNKVISQKSSNELLEAVTCSKEDENCLMGTCSDCLKKSLTFSVPEDVNDITYFKWVNVVEKRTIKEKEIKVKITKKEKITVNVKLAIEDFEKYLPIFMKHVAAIKHQYKFIKHLKETMNETEVLFHIDFSENFSCKYREEVQSIHFGASRAQITIHTGVAYTIEGKDEKVKAFSFATLSESLRHDPQAIWAHMHPVISHFLKNNPNIKKVHFLSDSPTTQYRNKTNFLFFHTINKRYSTIEEGTWNFSEAGHGKGAPDGVGAVVKRTADRLIAEGTDITNLDTLFDKISANVENVKFWRISDENISEMDRFISSYGDVVTVGGTMTIHQVTLKINLSSMKKDFRTLSCLTCSPDIVCLHYPIKKSLKRKRNVVPNGPEKKPKSRKLSAPHIAGKGKT